MIDSKSKRLTIFYTHYGFYKYKILPSKLINGLVIYQKYINNILFNYLDKFYMVYLDNILIYLNNKLKYKVYIKKSPKKILEYKPVS